MSRLRNSTRSRQVLQIAQAQSFLLRVPVRALQVDSQSTIEAWDVLAVRLVTDSGIEGWGYQTGFGPAMRALKAFVDNALLPDLVGHDVSMHQQWWRELYLLRHHTGLNGPAVQGVSAPEVAAWDAMAKVAGNIFCKSYIRQHGTNFLRPFRPLCMGREAVSVLKHWTCWRR